MKFIHYKSNEDYLPKITYYFKTSLPTVAMHLKFNMDVSSKWLSRAQYRRKRGTDKTVICFATAEELFTNQQFLNIIYYIALQYIYTGRRRHFLSIIPTYIMNLQL